jgi:hypothetical protein
LSVATRSMFRSVKTPLKGIDVNPTAYV